MKLKEDKMIEDIVKTQNFNNASTVEIRQGSKPAPQTKEVDKKVDTEKPEDKNVKEAMDKISNVANFYNRQIRLEIEEDLKIMIVKVIDGDTNEIIRQIPPKELVELSKHAKDQKGLLLNKEG